MQKLRPQPTPKSLLNTVVSSAILLAAAFAIAASTGVGASDAQTVAPPAPSPASLSDHAQPPASPPWPQLDSHTARAWEMQLLAVAEKAAGRSELAVPGRQGMLFLTAELRHLGIGPFWAEHAVQAGRAAREDRRDPLPVIVDYHRQLAEAGIELIFVPVPPKAAIYPDQLGPGVQVRITRDEKGRLPRVDRRLQQFYTLLAEQGVRVIDLTEPFLKARQENPDRLLYCLTDSHWSGHGLEIAAKLITEAVGRPDWLPQAPENGFTRERRSVTMRGDLLPPGAPAERRETLELTLINQGREPITDRNSPVVLLGDSHLLVFHIGGDMHATGGGLPDHLAARLGFPLDVLGVRGSGATNARRALLLRRDQLEGKRMIIWVMTAREFTEAQSWQKLPIKLP